MANSTGDAGLRHSGSLAERCDLVCAGLIEDRWRRAPGLALRIGCDGSGVVERPGRTRFDLQWNPDDRSFRGLLHGRWPWLPLADASFSLVVLDRLCVPAAEVYHPLLEEIVRILADDGRLLILDANPWGWVGLRARWRRHSVALASGRVRSLLHAVGLEDIEVTKALCWPPLPAALIERHGDWLDRMGSRWVPMPGSIYAVCGRKRGSNIIAIPFTSDRSHGMVAAPEGMRRAG